MLSRAHSGLCCYAGQHDGTKRYAPKSKLQLAGRQRVTRRASARGTTCILKWIAVRKTLSRFEAAPPTTVECSFGTDSGGSASQTAYQMPRVTLRSTYQAPSSIPDRPLDSDRH